MGGRVGLKGSDGSDIQRRARELGAVAESPFRAVDALKSLTEIKERIEVVAYPAEMGENEARECGLEPTVIGSITSGGTTSEDTQQAAREMEEIGVDLLLFAGGDGTARDIYNAVGRRVTALGIPAGVKIHSAVYAVTPRNAGTDRAHVSRWPAPEHSRRRGDGHRRGRLSRGCGVGQAVWLPPSS